MTVMVMIVMVMGFCAQKKLSLSIFVHGADHVLETNKYIAGVNYCRSGRAKNMPKIFRSESSSRPPPHFRRKLAGYV